MVVQLFLIEYGNYNIKHRFVYPYISGYYRGKWTHNPKEIDELRGGSKVFEETWTDEFRFGYKNGEKQLLTSWVE